MKANIKNYLLLLLTASLLLSQCKGKTNTETIAGTQDDLTPAERMAPTQANTEQNQQFLLEACLEGIMDDVVLMIKKGVDVNAADSGGRTPLMFASFNGHTDIVRILLDSGAETETVDSTGRTALIYGSTGPFPETISLLLERKADPNVVDYVENFTALMFAAAEGHMDVVKLLMDNGANPDLKDIDGDNAETFARQAGHIEVADFLK